MWSQVRRRAGVEKYWVLVPMGRSFPRVPLPPAQKEEVSAEASEKGGR